MVQSQRRKARSRAKPPIRVSPPTRRSRGRGVMLWPVFPWFRPPAPLSLGVGRVKRQGKAGFAKRQGQRVRKLINLDVIVIF